MSTVRPNNPMEKNMDLCENQTHNNKINSEIKMNFTNTWNLSVGKGDEYFGKVANW
jgi:hypothetical protein